MGLFFNKNKFDIVPKENELCGLVTKFDRVDVLKVNAKLVVPEGYFFAIGKKGKVCDIFDSGTHYLNASTLPLTCRKFNIDKQILNKKDKFKFDFYFISKNLFPAKFKTYRQIELGTKAYGVYKMHVYGIYSYSVKNVEEFMQSLLNEFDYIKTGESEKIVESWVNDLIVKSLEKHNFIISDIVKNDPKIAESIKLDIEKLFKQAGLDVGEVKIYKYKLPKEFQKQSDDIIKYQESGGDLNNNPTGGEVSIADDNVSDATIDNNESDQIENILQEKTLESEEQKDVETIKGKDNNSDYLTDILLKSPKVNVEFNINEMEQIKEPKTEYVPFGSFSFGENNSKNNTNSINEPPKQQKKFVDLDENNFDGFTNNTKRCYNCGAINSKESITCKTCGSKLEGDNYEI